MFKKHSQFYKPGETEQKPNEMVDVTNWSIGELSIYPEGARAKFIVESPTGRVSNKFLIPKHKYIFKKPYTEKSGTILYEQYWNEIIAYKLGRIIGIPVPPAFASCVKKENSEPIYGALIEWFYDYENKDNSKRGGDIINKYIDNYDGVKGEQHNFETIVKISTENQVENWLREWVHILLFDTIIANQDRHQDNWQIIQYAGSGKNYLSPAFDNGTSMGYKTRPSHMEKNLRELEKYFLSGIHHMKFSLDDAKKAGHLELLKKIMYNFPKVEQYIKEKLEIDISTISQVISELCLFDIDDKRYSLSKERADFIIKLLCYRFNRLKEEFNI